METVNTVRVIRSQMQAFESRVTKYVDKDIFTLYREIKSFCPEKSHKKEKHKRTDKSPVQIYNGISEILVK